MIHFWSFFFVINTFFFQNSVIWKTFLLTLPTKTDNDMKEKILFVCLGNICRSPAADGILKAQVRERGLDHLFEIDSCGIGSWHIGQLPDSRMRRHGQDHGYRFDHRARQISKDDFTRFDRIIVMDNDNYRAVSSLAPDKSYLDKVEMIARYLRHHKGQTTVPDPYYGNDRDFEFVIELLEDACEGIIDDILPKQTIRQ